MIRSGLKWISTDWQNMYKWNIHPCCVELEADWVWHNRLYSKVTPLSKFAPPPTQYSPCSPRSLPHTTPVTGANLLPPTEYSPCSPRSLPHTTPVTGAHPTHTLRGPGAGGSPPGCDCPWPGPRPCQACSRQCQTGSWASCWMQTTPRSHCFYPDYLSPFDWGSGWQGNTTPMRLKGGRNHIWHSKGLEFSFLHIFFFSYFLNYTSSVFCSDQVKV